MIEGVRIVERRKFCDERGTVSHMLKCNDKEFKQFGEIYFSSIHPGAIKAWHVHKKMTLNYVCIVGNIKLVLYDDRNKSKTNGEVMELFIGEENYCLVQIPPGVYNGFKAVGNKTAIVANCSTHLYEDGEMKRWTFDATHVNYNWDIKNG